MHETAAERERRLRQLGGGEPLWQYLNADWCFDFDETNPCRELDIVIRDIVINLPQVHRCALGSNPLVKFTKYKFKF